MKVFSLKEAAELLRISERTLHRLLEKGEILAARVGTQWRFTELDIDVYLRQNGSNGLLQGSDSAQGVITT